MKIEINDKITEYLVKSKIIENKIILSLAMNWGNYWSNITLNTYNSIAIVNKTNNSLQLI